MYSPSEDNETQNRKTHSLWIGQSQLKMLFFRFVCIFRVKSVFTKCSIQMMSNITMGTIEKIIIMRDVIRNIIHSQMSDFQCFQINHRILRAHNFTAREKKKRVRIENHHDPRDYVYFFPRKLNSRISVINSVKPTQIIWNGALHLRTFGMLCVSICFDWLLLYVWDRLDFLLRFRFVSNIA